MVLDQSDERESPDESPEPPEEQSEEDAGDDGSLSALADAEAELHAPVAQLAHDDGTLKYRTLGAKSLVELRQRGSIIWGAVALALAVNVWILPFLVQPILNRPNVWPLLGMLAGAMEVGMFLGAIVFGTLGCRRRAGRKMAFVARLAAWCLPIVAWGWAAISSTFVLFVAVLLWAVLGSFIFAILDTMVEP